MKKLYDILRITLWSFIGVFIGSSFYKFLNYKNHSDLYETQSAPWYLSIEINAVFTAIIVIIIFIIMKNIRKKVK